MQWRPFMKKRVDCIRKNRFWEIRHDFGVFFGTKAPKRTKLWGRWRKKTRRNVLPAFMEARHFLFGGQVMYNGGETFLFGGSRFMYYGGVCVKNATRMSCRHLWGRDIFILNVDKLSYSK
jgi:hypothetical protein